MVNATRPHVDSDQATVAIAARERDANAITYNAAQPMEDTGVCPAYAGGNLIRAKIEIPEGATWTLIKGIQAQTRPMGRR
jgi:hypothetical protein